MAEPEDDKKKKAAGGRDATFGPAPVQAQAPPMPAQAAAPGWDTTFGPAPAWARAAPAQAQQATPMDAGTGQGVAPVAQQLATPLDQMGGITNANLAAAANPAIAAPPLPQGQGFMNSGAMLPPNDWSPGQSMGAALQQRMMNQPTAASKLAEFQNPQMRLARNVDFIPAAPGSLQSFSAAGGTFVPESDAANHDRSMKAFQSLEGLAGAQQKGDLDAYLGVGGLGNQTAAQETAARAQMLNEYKGAFDMEQEGSGKKLYALMKAQGATDADATAAVDSMYHAFPNAGQQNFTPGQPIPGRGQKPIRVDGAGKPVGVAPQGNVADVTPGNDPASALRARRQTLTHADKLGSARVAQADKAKTVGEAAVSLLRGFDKPGNEDKGQAVMDYLNEKWGAPNVQKFMQPSEMMEFFNRFGNAMPWNNGPSEEQIVASQLRNMNGLKSNARPLFSGQ